MKQAKASASLQAPPSGYGSGGSSSAGTPMTPRRSFGSLPQPGTSPMGPPATTQPLPRRTQAPATASTSTGPSQRPGLFSTIPSLKPNVAPSSVPSGAGHGLPSAATTGLTVATPGVDTSVGGRSSFATDPFGVHAGGRSQTAGAPMKDSDAAVDSDLFKMASDASRKRMHEGDDGDNEKEGCGETEGSDIEDMTISTSRRGKARASPAKSAKKETATENYTDADIAIVRADRYGGDFPAVQNYRNNVASPDDTNCFNLASHEAYLDSVVATGGITSRVVFNQEGGRRYLQQRGVKDLTLYNNGWKLVLPRTLSGRFRDGTNTSIERVMMVYRRPNGVIVKDDDRDGFGRTCLLGLWGLHSERALIRCTHNTADGRGDKVVGVNVCPMCRFWNTNDVTLNNHVRKHYNMGLCCPEDGFVTGSASKMRSHLVDKHGYRMRSSKDKQADKQAAKKAAH